MKQNLYKTNSYYEGLIQNLFGGAKGSFALFMHFFYQYNQSAIFAIDYIDCFKQLYLLELKNCEILSQIILKMGGDNKYYSSQRKYLSGNNVDYVKNIERILVTDIEFLEISVLEVKSIINKIDNFEIKRELQFVLDNKKKLLKMLKVIFFKIN